MEREKKRKESAPGQTAREPRKCLHLGCKPTTRSDHVLGSFKSKAPREDFSWFPNRDPLWSQRQLQAYPRTSTSEHPAQCLPQLCAIQASQGHPNPPHWPSSGWELCFWCVLCFLRCASFPEIAHHAKRFDTLWEISVLYPCKLSTTPLK